MLSVGLWQAITTFLGTSTGTLGTLLQVFLGKKNDSTYFCVTSVCFLLVYLL